jgi:hypothetical protein
VVSDPREVPIFPPQSFVDRWSAASPDKVRTAMDPMVMMAWHQANEQSRQPFRLLAIGS